MRYFTIDEFDCTETGENEMDQYFLDALDALRKVCGFPFHISSGFRSVKHSKEKNKDKPGTHTEGIAADIIVSGGNRRYVLVNNAIKLGFTGIGVGKGFVHVDTRPGPAMMWSY